MVDPIYRALVTIKIHDQNEIFIKIQEILFWIYPSKVSCKWEGGYYLVSYNMHDLAEREACFCSREFEKYQAN